MFCLARGASLGSMREARNVNRVSFSPPSSHNSDVTPTLFDPHTTHLHDQCVEALERAESGLVALIVPLLQHTRSITLVAAAASIILLQHIGAHIRIASSILNGSN
eukprot:scaffold854_cov95-Skeletonema_dohrnii-CCMP3373.AAC.5